MAALSWWTLSLSLSLSLGLSRSLSLASCIRWRSSAGIAPVVPERSSGTDLAIRDGERPEPRPIAPDRAVWSEATRGIPPLGRASSRFPWMLRSDPFSGYPARRRSSPSTEGRQRRGSNSLGIATRGGDVSRRRVVLAEGVNRALSLWHAVSVARV